MKNFYDRVREMNELRELQRQAYNDYSRFVVLTGRRRVGKTALYIDLLARLGKMLLDFTSSLAERRKPYSSEPLYRRFAKNSESSSQRV